MMDADVLVRAKNRMQHQQAAEGARKSRPIKSRGRASRNWRNLETVKTLAGRLGQSPLSTSSPPISHSGDTTRRSSEDSLLTLTRQQAEVLKAATANTGATARRL